jgi:hypothetical protein
VLDALWLLTDSGSEPSELLDRALESLEQMPLHVREDFYSTRLPTLGDAIVQPLFRRLEAVAQTDDPMIIKQIAKAIIATEGADVPQLAKRSLHSQNPRTQRAAMLILSKRPSPAALDRLWELHCLASANPAPYLHSYEQHKYQLYEDSFGALRSCVRTEPTWLEKTINRLDDASEPGSVHDLAYLLANLDDAAPLWRRCKPILFRLVPATHERCLAACIYQHGDTDAIEWLVERVKSAVDSKVDSLLGPAALRALIRLAPDIAIQRLDCIAPYLLNPTRHWCFHELLTKQPENTCIRVAEMLTSSARPFELAWAFTGEENLVTPEILEVLLDKLEVILDAELRTPSRAGTTGLYQAFMLLSRLGYPELLERIQRRAGTPLEDKLTEWLLGRGAIPGGLSHPTGPMGLEVLYRMGGDGFTKVVNSKLQERHQHVRAVALGLAFKHPDQTTISLLRDISMLDELWGNHPIEQARAVEILGYLDKWPEAIEAIARWGTPVASDVVVARESLRPLDDNIMAPALAALTPGRSVTAGAVIALGLGGRVDQVARIRSILEEAEPESDLATACIQSLRMLNDSSPQTVRLLIDRLNVDRQRYSAQVTLLQSGSDLALDDLLGRLRGTFDVSLAINLLRNPASKDRATEIIRATLRETPNQQMEDTLDPLLAFAEEFSDTFISETRVRDFLRDTSFAEDSTHVLIGFKPKAVRCLSKFDPDAAFLAALKAMQNPASHDRGCYPYLLIELDAPRAVEALLEQASIEEDDVVLGSIARALRSEDLGHTVLTLSTSKQAKERLAACRVCRSNPRAFETMSALLHKLVEDGDERVAQTARVAIRLRRDALASDSLVSAISSTDDRNARWILLDALLLIADPGDAHRPWPEWAAMATRGRPYFEQKYVADRLKQRRDSLANEVKREAPRIAERARQS